MTANDEHLQAIADNVTEEGLRFFGAEFEHLDTGESFTVTVSKTSAIRELNDRVKILEAALADSLKELKNYEKTAGKMSYTRCRRKYLKLLPIEQGA